MRREKMINLGDKVKDSVSGFMGIAMSIHTYLHGCRRIGIQPKVNKDGTLPDVRTFDEPQLEVLTVKRVLQGSQKTGGPSKYEDEGK